MSESIASPKEIFGELKEFQRITAKYAYSRLYDASDPSLRFLVADEVGLGKTLVARGVIAQTIEKHKQIGDDRVDIVYICSNAAIAKQNLRKLNIAGDDAITRVDRLTMLAGEIRRLQGRSINLIAVTPGTSFNFGLSAGKFPERALLYAILQRVWGKDAMKGAGPERVFHHGIADDEEARKRLRNEAAKFELTAALREAFRGELRKRDAERQELGQPRLRIEFRRLAEVFHRKRRFSKLEKQDRNQFMSELRRMMATVGIDALEPDLVILDEFQRFRNLLDPDNAHWGPTLARQLFEYRDKKQGRPTRTLLLSATPYQPYTTADDEGGDDHFKDFVQTARFLLNDEEAAESLRTELRELRSSLFVLDRDGGASAEEACRKVSKRLQPVMARTEKLTATQDRNGMLKTVNVPTTLERADIDGFLAASSAAELLGHREVTEYWKSGPYLVNFMESYKLKRDIEDAIEEDRVPESLIELVASGKGLLDWNDVSQYESIDPANARLRALKRDTIERGMWQLLWLPPALPYYVTGGIFETPEAKEFTKRLIFSAWNLVPKIVSAMLSFEAERAAFKDSGAAETRAYGDFSDRSARLLDFRTEVRTEAGLEVESPAALANLNVIVPHSELARLADPLGLASAIRKQGKKPTLHRVQNAARARIREELKPITRGMPRSGAADQRWYWAAPLLIDLRADEPGTRAWWKSEAQIETWTAEELDDGSNQRLVLHLRAARKFVLDPSSLDRPLGRVPDDLADVLVACALGSPATCALRSLQRLSEKLNTRSSEPRNAAARIAWGFRSMYNGPLDTAIVRSATEADPYWRAVLEYGMLGNLQAMLDEYMHTLKGWRGFVGKDEQAMAGDLAATACSALSMRTVGYRADILTNENGKIHLDRPRMRGKFAIRFGDKSIESDQSVHRAETASQAFNSPFWPYVLSTTSVGQEGLDFHLYSHAVVHWNLPSNPVDFEQREGRVHRYKGHAVRKNVATVCGDVAFTGDVDSDPWTTMFDEAARVSKADGELSPYWIFSPEGSEARIERHVPILPMSRDAGKRDRLLKALAIYKLSLGQPHQEELLEYLAGRIPENELAGMVERLKVDLTPR